jgi:hypothetical protein
MNEANGIQFKQNVPRLILPTLSGSGAGAARTKEARQRAKKVLMNIIVIAVQIALCVGNEQKSYREEGGNRQAFIS